MKEGKDSRRLSFILLTIIVTLAVSVVLSLSLSPYKTNVSADTATDLFVGDNEVDLNGFNESEPLTLAFVPEQSGYYMFVSLNEELGTSAELWLARDHYTPGGVYLDASSSDGPDKNFRVIAELEADETYELVCWNTNNGGSWNDNNSEYYNDYLDNYHYDYTTTVRVALYNTETDPNRCGQNATWSFDSGSGTLTITGTGAMYDKYEFFDNQVPWASIKNQISSVVISEGITCIGCETFSDCSNLISVVIPESVTDIRYCAFNHCTKLANIFIPNSVNKIGMMAFMSCEGMESLTIEDGVKEIAPKAFSECSGITNLTIPQSVTDIGFDAFEYCTSLESLTVLGGNIEDGAFRLCYSLKDLTVGEGVRLIGAEAFSDCEELERVTLKNGIEHIGEYAFAMCTNLTNISIPKSVKSVGKYFFADRLGPQMHSSARRGNVFWGCESLADVYCYANPEILEWYGDTDPENSFIPSSSGNKTKFHVSPEYKDTFATKYNGVNADFAGDLVDTIDINLGDNEVNLNESDSVWLSFVPEETGYYMFDALNIEVSTSAELWDLEQFPDGNYVVSSSSGGPSGNFRILTELTAGKTYLLKCSNTFESDYHHMYSGYDYDYDRTTTVRVVSYISEIAPNSCGKNATWSFDSESGTLTISGTGDMYDIFDYFDNQVPWASIKNQVSSVVIDEGITCIGCEAFSGFSNLTRVVIPESVTDIRYHAFGSCSKLDNVTIPSKTKSIGALAFAGCTSLTGITIPGSVGKIEMAAFLGAGLESLTIMDGVKEIAPYAFRACANLKSVTIPESVISIGFLSFDSCSALESVTIQGGNLGDGVFRSCGSLKNVSIGQGVSFIGCDVFCRCPELESVTLEEGVKHIGEYAFSGCEKLESITIPGSVISIGKYTFIDRSGPKCINDRPYGDAFHGCTNLSDLYCYANPEKLEWYGDDDPYMSFLPPSSESKTKCHVFAEYADAYAAKFNKVNVDFVDDLSNKINMGLCETLYGYTVSIGSNIGVNCYVHLDPDTLSDNAYMLFTVPSGDSTTTQQVFVKDIVSSNGVKTIDGTSYYIFTCKVSAKDMASTITAQLIDGENQGSVYKFSTKTYAEYIIAHQDDPQYSNAAPLARAMLVYGTWAQKYFKVNLNTIDNSLLDETEISGVSITPPQTTFNLPDGVTYEYATLSLKSETTLSLYFTSEKPLSFTCFGKTVETKKVDSYQVARIRGITAVELGNSFNLSISCENGNGNVEFSPLNYCYNILNGTYSDDLKNVVRALYKYYEATQTFINNGG